MRINIKVVGTKPADLEKEIKFKFITVKNGLKKLGFDTALHMKQVIQSNKKTKSKQNTLENAIKVYVEETLNRQSVGVGRIQELDVLAPYWAAVNYGAHYMIPKSGDMYPKNAQALKFIGKKDGAVVYASKVKQRVQNISPMNYIEKTVNWLLTVWKVQFYNWTSVTKTHAR